MPGRDPDEVTQYDHLFKRGDSHALAVHLGQPESTLVFGSTFGRGFRSLPAVSTNDSPAMASVSRTWTKTC